MSKKLIRVPRTTIRFVLELNHFIQKAFNTYVEDAEGWEFDILEENIESPNGSRKKNTSKYIGCGKVYIRWIEDRPVLRRDYIEFFVYIARTDYMIFPRRGNGVRWKYVLWARSSRISFLPLVTDTTSGDEFGLYNLFDPLGKRGSHNPFPEAVLPALAKWRTKAVREA